MNLAYKYPLIFWETANLIVDSGAMNLEQEINIEEETEDEEKIENSSCNYGKIATAIGNIQSRNVKFSLPDINKSDISFIPDVENNIILYGLRGITRIGNQLIKDIICNRPYNSIEDFLSKVKVNKVQMISLIKAGTFDNLYKNREKAMSVYLDLISDKKKRITLQNMTMLIAKNMIPKELDLERRIFNFNKYIRTTKDSEYVYLDTHSTKFFTDNFDESLLEDIRINGSNISSKLKLNKWENLYKKAMDPVRKWMKENQQEILDNLNNSLRNEIAEKYAEGNISKWEMDSLSFYYHEHELLKLDKLIYNLTDFSTLPKEPEIEKSFPSKDGGEINIYKIHRIAGTVIDKDKNKNTVTLLTPTGVVIVKVWKNQFNVWDKQISEKQLDGTKHVLEKSWFTRGNKLIITGIKRDGTFVPKKYKNTEYPLFEKIISINDKGIITESITERPEVEE